MPNIADWLRAELLNYELAIAYAESRIAYFSAKMERHRGKNTPRAEARFVNAKVSKERYVCFRDDLMKAKTLLAQNIDSALGSYPSVYQKVFWLSLLEQKPVEDVSAECGISEEAVRSIRAKLIRDLYTLYGE